MKNEKHLNLPLQLSHRVKAFQKNAVKISSTIWGYRGVVNNLNQSTGGVCE